MQTKAPLVDEFGFRWVQFHGKSFWPTRFGVVEWLGSESRTSIYSEFRGFWAASLTIQLLIRSSPAEHSRKRRLVRMIRGLIESWSLLEWHKSKSVRIRRSDALLPRTSWGSPGRWGTQSETSRLSHNDEMSSALKLLEDFGILTGRLSLLMEAALWYTECILSVY